MKMISMDWEVYNKELKEAQEKGGSFYLFLLINYLKGESSLEDIKKMWKSWRWDEVVKLIEEKKEK